MLATYGKFNVRGVSIMRDRYEKLNYKWAFGYKWNSFAYTSAKCKQNRENQRFALPHGNS